MLAATDDARRAGSLQVVVVAVVPVFACLTLYLAGVLGPLLGVFPEATFPVKTLQGLAVALAIVLGVVGVRPSSLLSIQGRRTVLSTRRGVSLDGDLRSVEIISRQRFHEQYARLRGTATVGRLSTNSTLVLLDTTAGSLIVSLSASAAASLHRKLSQTATAGRLAA